MKEAGRLIASKIELFKKLTHTRQIACILVACMPVTSVECVRKSISARKVGVGFPRILHGMSRPSKSTAGLHQATRAFFDIQQTSNTSYRFFLFFRGRCMACIGNRNNGQQTMYWDRVAPGKMQQSTVDYPLIGVSLSAPVPAGSSSEAGNSGPHLQLALLTSDELARPASALTDKLAKLGTPGQALPHNIALPYSESSKQSLRLALNEHRYAKHMLHIQPFVLGDQYAFVIPSDRTGEILGDLERPDVAHVGLVTVRKHRQDQIVFNGFLRLDGVENRNFLHQSILGADGFPNGVPISRSLHSLLHGV
ncbi:hypothetical protein PHSY_005530 [Pseudozyma hubeiensis SY62]|uniref:Uncharacterized protein n=1 Tax=Pseudozyma hubeiensis (strain SY62) TaxID=1305764 RepID=R9P9M5_PSEHS|nr:hypothetical protein PHSY_005530 [Pseudozyma hubeiensis SY62]GAC97942.1 hypothetical protein PHSY_005530 [Pseudozyma hubeiensis SY62]